MVKGDISFYVDTLILETALGESSLSKTAQSSALSGLADMVKNYFSAHFDGSNKVNSVINMLAPGAISMLFRSLGFGKIGMLLGLAASALHIDVAAMVESIFNSLRSSLESGHVSPAQVDSAVNQAVQQHAADPASSADQTPAWDKQSLDKELREARLVRLALERADTRLFQLRKDAAPAKGLFATSRGATGNLIGRVIGFVFKLILASAGFMVAGDLINKFLGRPNAIDRTYQAGQTPTEAPTAAPAPTTTQTKFKVNPGYQNATHPRPWIEQVHNDAASIENMLVDFTKQVYDGLNGKETLIRSSPTFQAVKSQIEWYNHSSPGDAFIYIPPNYSSVKSIVDHYIDEVAKNA